MEKRRVATGSPAGRTMRQEPVWATGFAAGREAGSRMGWLTGLAAGSASLPLLPLLSLLLGAPQAMAEPTGAERSAAVPAAQASTSGTPAGRLFWVLRHAEKGQTPSDDPDLTEAGRQRAEDLARLLGQSGVEVLYATDTRRSQQTLEPLAARLGLVPDVHHIDDPYGMVRKALDGGSANAVLVGHVDTVIMIVEGLGARVHEDFGAVQYDDLFLVTVPPTGPARVSRLKYGTSMADATASVSQEAAMTADYDPLLAARLGADERGMRMYVFVTLLSGPTKVGKEEAQKIFSGHMSNMNRLAEAGKLVLAGPFS